VHNVFVESINWSEVLIPLVAEIGLTLLLLTLLLVDLFTRPRRRVVGLLAGVGMLLVMLLNLIISWGPVTSGAFPVDVLGGMVRFDMMGLIFRTMILVAGALTAFIALDTPNVGDKGEFFAILTSATLGMSLMSIATDLIMVFLSVETASISLYILAGFLRDTPRSTEAGIKYYLFGAATAGIFLYGLSLLFGFTGTTNIYQLAAPLAELAPWSWRCCWYWSASVSRLPPCPSTSGPPTYTRARPRRSPPSSAPPARPPVLRCSCVCSSPYGPSNPRRSGWRSSLRCQPSP